MREVVLSMVRRRACALGAHFREGSDSKVQLENEISRCSGAADTTLIAVAGGGYFTAVCSGLSHKDLRDLSEV